METSLLPIALFMLLAGAMAVGIYVLGKLIGPKRNTAVKEMPYESGMDPIHDTHRRFDVRFHLVAIAFLVFDVELLFLYPWAVAVGFPSAVAGQNSPGINAAVTGGLVSSRGLVFGGVMFFMVLLIVGLIYDWRKGLFKWR